MKCDYKTPFHFLENKHYIKLSLQFKFAPELQKMNIFHKCFYHICKKSK